MKLFRKVKDGGPESKVWAYVLIEIKPLFSVMLLKFEHGSREAFHTHAFNAVSWLFRGLLREDLHGDPWWACRYYWPSFRPIWTPRRQFHKVTSSGTSWALTFRGPWVAAWREYLPNAYGIGGGRRGRFQTLTHGRQVLA